MPFSIRLECDDEDRRFIEGLNPRLTEVITAPTHSSTDVRSFQEAFTATAWRADGSKNATFLATEETGKRIGYVNVREGSDDVLGEACGYVALLAVEQEHEGTGVAQSLVKQAERWAKEMGPIYLFDPAKDSGKMKRWAASRVSQKMFGKAG